MPTYEENLRDFFGLPWRHGSCEIPYEYAVLYADTDKEKALCEFGKQQGFCEGSYPEYILFSKHHETLNKYRKEHQDYYQDKILPRHMFL